MSVDQKEDDAGSGKQPHSDDEVISSAKEAAAVLQGDVKKMADKIEKDDDDGGSSSKLGNEDDDGETSSFGRLSCCEEGDFPEDLKEYARKALFDLRSKLEVAILTNTLLIKPSPSTEVAVVKEPEPQKHDHRHHRHHHHRHRRHHSDEDKEKDKDKGKAKMEEMIESESAEAKVNKDITLWGVPLLPSKGDKSTDVLLVKFLRAKDFKANEAFDMLRNSLIWRKENKMDSIMEEDFGHEYDSVSYMLGTDRQGHPVCYNVYGVFANEDIYNKTFGSEGGRERFLRWRLQLLEKEINKLDFSPGGITTLLQVNDLKDTPGPSRRDLRLATKQAVAILQDNYPEFVSRNIFINVPFWYYAFNALLSPFLTQATKSKFVFSRPARVTETLSKYVAAEEIPVQYGGLLRDHDPDFSPKDVASEIMVKAGATETIEIAAPEAGRRLVWDVAIVGWDVNYKEEFVPKDEKSYTMIVRKQRKVNWQHEPIRNSFVNKEPGRLVITIENGMFKKKKVLYRFKNNS